MKNDLDIINSFLKNKFGIVLDDKRKRIFNQTLNKRIKKTGMENAETYYQYIKSHNGREELQELISFLTIGETYFLRNLYQWKALQKYIIPQIVKDKKGKPKTLSIWSAGCSTGEESYTIAIMLYESLPFMINWDIKIMATDVNGQSLNMAKKGLYSENAFRETPCDFRNKYFFPVKDKYKIDPKFKSLVEFKKFNFISNNHYSVYENTFDIIFCRNVLMYFSPDVSKRILQSLTQCLVQNGYLFLGHVEGPIAKHASLKPISVFNTIVYQKTVPQTTDQSAQITLPEKYQQLLPSNKTSSACTSIQKNSTYNDSFENSENRIIYQNDSIENIYDKALNCYANGKIDAAMQLIESCSCVASKDKLNMLILSGLIQINKKNIEKARWFYNQALTDYDLTPETYMLGAIINEEKMNFENAIKDCRNAIFLDNQFFYPHFRLGSIYNKLGDHEKKQKAFQNALNLLKYEKKERFLLFCEGYSETSLRKYILIYLMT